MAQDDGRRTVWQPAARARVVRVPRERGESSRKPGDSYEESSASFSARPGLYPAMLVCMYCERSAPTPASRVSRCASTLSTSYSTDSTAGAGFPHGAVRVLRVLTLAPSTSHDARDGLPCADPPPALYDAYGVPPPSSPSIPAPRALPLPTPAHTPPSAPPARSPSSAAHRIEAESARRRKRARVFWDPQFDHSYRRVCQPTATAHRPSPAVEPWGGGRSSCLRVSCGERKMLGKVHCHFSAAKRPPRPNAPSGSAPAARRESAKG
jgi:hypothetical protein